MRLFLPPPIALQMLNARFVREKDSKWSGEKRLVERKRRTETLRKIHRVVGDVREIARGSSHPLFAEDAICLVYIDQVH